MCVGVRFTRAWAAEQWLHHWRKWPSNCASALKHKKSVWQSCVDNWAARPGFNALLDMVGPGSWGCACVWIILFHTHAVDWHLEDSPDSLPLLGSSGCVEMSSLSSSPTGSASSRSGKAGLGASGKCPCRLLACFAPRVKTVCRCVWKYLAGVHLCETRSYSNTSQVTCTDLL